MSDTAESPPLSSATTHSPPPPTAEEPRINSTTKQDLTKDILLWRRKVLNLIVLLVTTAIWVLLDVYQFNFITVASWAAISVVASLFFLGNMNRLLGREPPKLSEMEIDEQSATKMANNLREWVEEGLRWMFRVGAEREWYISAGAVACLYVLSLVAKYFDFLTLLYIGVVLGLSVPIMYVKYEHKIKELGQRLRNQGNRYYDVISEKLRKIRHKMVREEKVKKTE